jgi:tetratricopeptide (TPR) repeat protein
MRAGLPLIALACCLWAAPIRAQTTIEMSKCSDISFMGPQLAIDYCTRAIKSGALSNRYMGMAYFNRGMAYAIRGNLERGIADLTEAARYEAIAPEPDSWRSMTFTSRANLQVLRQQYDAALADFAEALRLDPMRAEIYVRRGQVWLAKREPDRALVDFDEALRRDIGDRSFYSGVGMNQRDERRIRDRTVHDSTAYLGRGQALLQKGNAEAALVEFEKAIGANPANPMLFAQRALTRQEQGDLDGAIADYGEVIRLNPNDAGAYNRRGALWHAKGDEPRALADLEAARKVKPERRPVRVNPDLEVERSRR